MKKVEQPIDCVIGTTYNCNSRCTMCNIWKIKNSPELPVAEYKKLPQSLRDINISGGEPFLRKDIVEIVRVVHERCPKARIVISSNGFMPDLIEKRMKEILKIMPDIGVAISVDGYKDMHEKIRRIPDAWNKDMDTIERLQKLGMKNLRLAFTILPENIQDFGKVYDESKKRGIQFTHAFAQSSEHYFGIDIDNNPDKKELKKQYLHIMNSELSSWNPKKWVRAFFAHGLYKFSIEKKQVLNNDPGTKFFYLDPDGVVYPSVVHNFPMGNLREHAYWDSLWQGKKANESRKQVRTIGQPAWMICTARTAIKKNPHKVACWIVKNKITGMRDL
ncbi:radical SAM protein [Patescibacteria group bacterium]|nr:radical SAM protein [Patescibacteria group bacterium]MBU1721851.1 radical SAM protein [Patescibacteria group bacterium]MBU1901654.1 radical SAM protein [Patescibacteria group bacterium]